MTEMKIGILNKNYTFKLQINLDHHSPILKFNDSLLPDPSHFSLLATFKGTDQIGLAWEWYHWKAYVSTYLALGLYFLN